VGSVGDGESGKITSSDTVTPMLKVIGRVFSPPVF
jgi:hypothetical protein